MSIQDTQTSSDCFSVSIFSVSSSPSSSSSFLLFILSVFVHVKRGKIWTVCSVSGATPLFWQPIILKCKAHCSENTPFSCSYFSDCQPSSWWGPLIGFLSGLRPNGVLSPMLRAKISRESGYFVNIWPLNQSAFVFKVMACQTNGLSVHSDVLQTVGVSEYRPLE